MKLKINIFIVMGVFLIIAGSFAPNLLAVFLGDSTPPKIDIMSKPANGSAYPADVGVTTLTVYCYDVESNISSVVTVIDGTTHNLAYQGPAYSGRDLWTKNVTALASGSHTFTTTVTNGVGLTAVTSGSFTIYGVLSGSWFINTVLVSSPTQVIPSQTLTATFKFVKTQGKDDIYISAYVKEGAATVCTLTLTAANTWTGSYTFASGGLHTLILEATDGAQRVTMQVVGLKFPGGDATVSLNMTQLIFWGAGVACLAYGFMGKRRLKTF